MDSLGISERFRLIRLLRSTGDNEGAALCADTADQRAKEGRLDHLALLSMSQKAVALMRQANYVDASKVFVDGITIATQQRDTVALALLEQQWGSMYFYTNDFDEAIRYTKLALGHYQLLRNEDGIATTMDNIGLYFQNKEQYDSAYYYQQQALLLFEKSGDTARLIVSYNNVGTLLKNTGQFVEAEKYLQKSLDLAEQKQDEYRIVNALISLGNLYDTTKNEEKLVAVFERAYEIAMRINDNFHAYKRHMSCRIVLSAG